MKSHLLRRLLLIACFFAVTPFLSAKEVTFAGGDGSSMEKAVIIKNATEETGVHAEYTYLQSISPAPRPPARL